VSGWRAILRAERYRTWHTRSSPLLLLVLFCVPAFAVLARYAGEARSRAAAALSGSSAGEAASSGSGWAPLVDGWRVGLALGSLLLFVHALRSVSVDRENGLLRMAVVRGVRRRDLVVGRALFACVLVVSVFLVTGLGAFAASFRLYDFGALVEDGYVLAEAGELRDELWRAAALALPGLLATYAFGLCLSSASRTSTGALVSGLILFLGFDLFKDTLGAGQYWIFAAYTPSLVDGSALGEMSGIARGYSDAGFSSELSSFNLWLPWPQALLLLLISTWAVSRRNL